MIQTRNRTIPRRVVDKAASNRNNNQVNNNGTQTIAPRNVLLKEEQMWSRIAKNRIKVDSGELRKAPDYPALALHTMCRGCFGFHFMSRFIMEDTWQTKG
jgi:hypothetical protein